MPEFTLTTTVAAPYEQTVARVREQLAEVGFGVLTEIDFAATLKNKLDVDIAPKIILGACRPPLAHQAVQADPRLAALLPCNVVVSDQGDGTTLVEVLDPGMMSQFSASDEVGPVADDARERLGRMLAAVAEA